MFKKIKKLLFFLHVLVVSIFSMVRNDYIVPFQFKNDECYVLVLHADKKWGFLKKNDFTALGFKTQHGSPRKKVWLNKNDFDLYSSLEVTYISGKDLYNKSNKDFTWVKLDDIVKAQKSTYQVPHKKFKDAMSDDFFKFIQDFGKPCLDETNKNFNNAMKTSRWPNEKIDDIDVITFYDKNKKYYSFTNTFSKGNSQEDPSAQEKKDYSVTIYEPTADKKITWNSTEHYFQAGKFKEPVRYAFDLNKITTVGHLQGMDRPKDFKDKQYPFNQENKRVNLNDWRNGKNKERMMHALWAKFTQHEDLQKLLLKTDGKILIEDAGFNDSLWGAGPFYQGCNHLGQMLMQVRDIMLFLKNEGEKIPKEAPKNFVYTPYAPEKYLERYKNKKLMVNLTQKTSKEDIKESIEVVNSFAKSLKSIAKK